MASNVGRVQATTRIAAEAEWYSRHFAEFVKAAWNYADGKPLVWNWHLDALCQHLQAVADGRIKKLLINIPPGTGKSMIVGVLFPAWMWTHRPSWKALSLSHNLGQAIRDTRKSRTLIKSQWYQERWPISFTDDQDQKGSYENDQFGSRYALPFSSATGNRGNCVIVDDPHSVDEAKSDAERTARVETFWDTLSNRLNDAVNDTFIVVMQRLHETDVSGSILEKDVGYVHLCIPMEFEGDKSKTSIGWKDPRKKVGELMFPELFPASAIADKKKEYAHNPTIYSGQYQQRPSPADSGDIDINWFRDTRFKLGEQPKGCNFYMTSDHAVSGKGDFNVFRIWGMDARRDLYLADSFRAQCTLQEALGIKRTSDGSLIATQGGALHLVKKWKPLAYYPEDDNNWKSVGGMFEQAMREAGVWVRIKPQSPSGLGDKLNKAQPFIHLAALGQIHLPIGSIGDIALAEYAKFPVGKHDDQVDADGMIGRVYGELRPGYIPTDMEEIRRAGDYAPNRNGGLADSDSFFI